MDKILVSACLLGENCKYNGGNNLNKNVVEFLKNREYIEVCPEVMGKLTTPRVPSEIEYGKTAIDVLSGNAEVVSRDGVDVTGEFLVGAEKTLKIAIENKVKLAVLKESSPSCGCTKIYNGRFEGIKIEGKGVTAQLLHNNGIKVLSEESTELSNFTKDTTI